MAEWTHRCCERCWFDGKEVLHKMDDGHWDLREVEPIGAMSDPEHANLYRTPVQVVDAEPGACCVCGGMTITGIFFRRDERELLCLGRHEPEQLGEWSRIGLAAS